MQVGVMNNTNFGANWKIPEFKPRSVGEIISSKPGATRIPDTKLTREILGLPADATYAEVLAKHAENKARLTREFLGLPANATNSEVAAKHAENRARIIRENLGLPVDASEELVQRTIAANRAKLFIRTA